ncbi:TPA: alpha/beta hydrolase [Candidatus Woesearchaeota archaeon]|nr:alpha/beta hydrolase [Candidatus Woesearchaeota archaeon]
MVASFTDVPYAMLKEMEQLDNVVIMFVEGIIDQWKKAFGFRNYQTLDQTVEKAMKEHGAERVHLVGHSMGGLEAVAYALNNPDKVGEVVTVGTPYQGSIVAPAGIFVMGLGVYAPTIWQIMPGSGYLQKLKKRMNSDIGVLEQEGVKITNVYSPFDELLPGSGGSLEGIMAKKSKAITEKQMSWGHMHLFFCDDTLYKIYDLERSRLPVVLIHGWAMNENFFRRIRNARPEEMRKNLYTFTFDYTKSLKI